LNYSCFFLASIFHQNLGAAPRPQAFLFGKIT